MTFFHRIDCMKERKEKKPSVKWEPAAIIYLRGSWSWLLHDRCITSYVTANKLNDRVGVWWILKNSSFLFFRSETLSFLGYLFFCFFDSWHKQETWGVSKRGRWFAVEVLASIEQDTLLSRYHTVWILDHSAIRMSHTVGVEISSVVAPRICYLCLKLSANSECITILSVEACMYNVCLNLFSW